MAGAQARVIVAVAHLDVDLFGADRRCAAARQRVEGGAAGGIGIGGNVDLPIDPGLVQPGNPGDGTDLGVDRDARLRRGRGGGDGGIGLPGSMPTVNAPPLLVPVNPPPVPSGSVIKPVNSAATLAFTSAASSN